MAYADKITNMRRMAIIVQGHDLVWEGVDIEGICLLRKYSDGCIMIKSIGELREWLDGANDERDFDGLDHLVIRYQDKKTKDSWEPRSKGFKQ